MKRTGWVVLSVVSLVLLFGFYASARAEDDASSESRYQALSEELNKNKEMLQIWKDHVRSLTKDRDEAYRQIQTLKTRATQAGDQGRVLRKGGVEIQSLPNQAAFQQLQQNYQAQADKLKQVLVEKENADRKIQELAARLQNAPSENAFVSSPGVYSDTADQIKDLNYQIDRLRYDNERLKIAEKEAVDLRAQIESFRSQKETMRSLQDRQEANKAEQERLTKENGLLREQAQDLRSQAAMLQTELVKARADNGTIKQTLADYKNRFESQRKESESATLRINQLAKENQDLRDIGDAQARLNDNLKASLQAS